MNAPSFISMGHNGIFGNQINQPNQRNKERVFLLYFFIYLILFYAVSDTVNQATSGWKLVTKVHSMQIPHTHTHCKMMPRCTCVVRVRMRNRIVNLAIWNSAFSGCIVISINRAVDNEHLRTHITELFIITLRCICAIFAVKWTHTTRNQEGFSFILFSVGNEKCNWIVSPSRRKTMSLQNYTRHGVSSEEANKIKRAHNSIMKDYSAIWQIIVYTNYFRGRDGHMHFIRYVNFLRTLGKQSPSCALAAKLNNFVYIQDVFCYSLIYQRECILTWADDGMKWTAYMFIHAFLKLFVSVCEWIVCIYRYTRDEWWPLQFVRVEISF